MSQRSVLSEIRPLFISISLAFIAFGFLSAIIPLKARLSGFSDILIGLFGTVYYLGFMIGCLLSPTLIGRIHHARAFTIFLAISVTAPLLFLIMINPYIWLVLRFMTGLCLAGARIILESWLNSLSSMRTRKTAITAYAIVVCVMDMVGQNMINLGNFHSFEIFWIAAIFFSLSIIPVIATNPEIPQPPQKTHLRLDWIFKTAALPAICCFCIGLLNGPYVAYTSLFLFDKGYSSSASVLFMSCLLLGGAVFQIPIAACSRFIGYKNTIPALSSVGIIVAFVTSFAEISYTQILISAVLFGASFWPIYSLSIAKANDGIEQIDMVNVASGLLFLYAAGSVAGAFTMSWIAGIFGVKYLFIYYAAIHAFLGLTFFLSGCKKTRPTTPSVPFTAIDPRLPEFSVLY